VESDGLQERPSGETQSGGLINHVVAALMVHDPFEPGQATCSDGSAISEHLQPTLDGISGGLQQQMLKSGRLMKRRLCHVHGASDSLMRMDLGGGGPGRWKEAFPREWQRGDER